MISGGMDGGWWMVDAWMHGLVDGRWREKKGKGGCMIFDFNARSFFLGHFFVIIAIHSQYKNL